MWEVVKRIGSFVVSLPRLEPFERREDAEEFARRLLASNPSVIAQGREAIEVRLCKIPDA
jgi:hypothetical protein